MTGKRRNQFIIVDSSPLRIKTMEISSGTVPEP
jgi:hypothetical protein